MNHRMFRENWRDRRSIVKNLNIDFPYEMSVTADGKN